MADDTRQPYRPRMSDAGLAPTRAVQVRDEYGDSREVHIAGESPLTLFVDDREIVTLMTLGSRPEALAIGYLRTQRFVQSLEEIAAVEVDWERESVRVGTHHGVEGWDEKLKQRTVTTGCGQGTVFSCTIDHLYDRRLPAVSLRQSRIYELLETLSGHNDVYRSAGAVHGCALCGEGRILHFVEDVGRHNAADSIAGLMWLDGIGGGDKLFYTTGRLTSEIVMKTALMGIPVLLSRSGVTHMGLELARDLGMTMIARAKGRHFLVFNGSGNLDYDAPPERRDGAAVTRLSRAAGE
jgi:FdhD protein